ncbi:hypothetical protein FDP41_010156 [Naegleria fowleri]|uniref:Uncharacterized protein n=1 Tax=Naegleria fowleri TaxID=5763 RepID=A0A6A5BBS1_NAEFO|nr:uncharacterized protein FDP41_010156 [Naegleria fowleri]KAF0971550.1 hypothetical protein FDP41_010156 [Naegleria fowleri]CAG4717103.1 unnamed protein product [Naegleria fowleri]
MVFTKGDRIKIRVLSGHFIAKLDELIMTTVADASTSATLNTPASPRTNNSNHNFHHLSTTAMLDHLSSELPHVSSQSQIHPSPSLGCLERLDHRKTYVMIQQAGSSSQKGECTKKHTMKRVKSRGTFLMKNFCEDLGNENVSSVVTSSNHSEEDSSSADDTKFYSLSNPNSTENLYDMEMTRTVSQSQIIDEQQGDDFTEFLYQWNQDFVFPEIELTLHQLKFWFTLMEARSFRKDKKLAEGSLLIDGDDLLAINNDKTVKVNMRTVSSSKKGKNGMTSVSSSQSDLDSHDDSDDADHQSAGSPNSNHSSTNNTPNFPSQEEEKIVGYLEVIIRIERDEHFAVAHFLEDSNCPERIELSQWNATSKINSQTVSTGSLSDVNQTPSLDIHEHIKDWVKHSVSKNFTIFLPPHWKPKKIQTVNKSSHTHYEADFWSDRCLGSDTEHVEILSIVYQKVCSKTDEDFNLTKSLYETMVLHKLSAEAMNGVTTLEKNQDVTSNFGIAFDSVSRYHYSFLKRIGFAQVDHVLYIFKPKGLNVMLCASLETSFGLGQAEHDLLQYAAQSAIIIYQ